MELSLRELDFLWIISRDFLHNTTMIFDKTPLCKIVSGKLKTPCQNKNIRSG